MQAMGIFEAKNKFSELCERVARTGEPVLVTRRGVGLVRVVPLERCYGAGEPENVWQTVEEGQARYGALPEAFELPGRSVEDNRKDPL
jgi:prevent-host-death family protein